MMMYEEKVNLKSEEEEAILEKLQSSMFVTLNKFKDESSKYENEWMKRSDCSDSFEC